MALIGLFFLLGMALVIGGWRLAGKLTGLLIMVAGLVLLMAALLIYNKKFR